MKNLLLFFILFLLPSFSFSQSILVNEYFNASSGDDEWVELVTTQEVNLSGFTLKDFTSGGGSRDGLTFTNHSLWTSMQAGVIILVINTNVSSPAEDFDPADGVVVIKSTNTEYFQAAGIFSVAGSSDAIHIVDASNNHIHGISHGSGNESSLPSPNAHFGSGLSSGQSLGFAGTNAIGDFSIDGRLTNTLTPSPASGNDSDNIAFLGSLFTSPSVPTLSLLINASPINLSETISLGSVLPEQERLFSIDISNIGEDDLEVSSISVTGNGFTLSENIGSTTIPQFESETFELSFRAQSSGSYSGSLSILSNDPDNGNLQISLTAEVISSDDIISLSEARTLDRGTTVTVGGRISVANEFGSPSYFEDGTAGLAYFNPEFSQAVSRGDSLIILGQLTEFGDFEGPGSGLLQINLEGSSYQILTVDRVEPRPLLVQLNQLSNTLQGRLVTVENVNISAQDETFSGDQNYSIGDGTASSEIRIDAQTNLVGETIPSGLSTITGVLSQFAGRFQILPRSVDDIIATGEREIAGEDVSFDDTFDVVTWNVEWLGSTNDGPSNVTLQANNVTQVLQDLDVDLIALQEVVDRTVFNSIVSNLEGYSGFVADYSQSQKTAYIYKTATVDSIRGAFLSTEWTSSSNNSNPWAAGRWPFEFIFRARINGVTERMHAINIHAKAFGEQVDYLRRVDDSNQLKTYLDQFRSFEKVILLGDFNDGLTVSTYNSAPSPYRNFDSDPDNYFLVTKSLELQGYTSFRASSMLDHMIISNDLEPLHFENTQRVVYPDNIPNFNSTTSDHFPVLTRFIVAPLVSTENDDVLLPKSIRLEQNYPNPFNPSTTIQFSLPQTHHVQLEIFSLLGVKVATLANGAFSAGEHELSFDASSLSSGIYFYQLRIDSGQSITRKMTLMK